MDFESVARGGDMNRDQALTVFFGINPPNRSIQPYVVSTLASLLESETVESQSLAEAVVMTFKIGSGAIFGMICRVASSARSVSVSTSSAGVVFGQGHMFEDACYIEFVETRKLWRVARPPSQIQVRRVEELELTEGCKDLIVKAGCTFMTSIGTARQESRPIEVPFGLVGSTMLSLGFDNAHKGQFLVYGPRAGRSIRSTVSIVPDVDPFGRDSFSRGLDIQVENHVLKATVRVTVAEKASFVVHMLKTIYKNIPFTDNGREIVRRKLRTRNGSVVLV